MNFAHRFKYLLFPLFIGLFLTINTRAAGDVDLSFNGSAQNAVNGAVLDSYQQPNGKIVLGGNFTAINGYAENSVARLNADGTLDTTFNAPDYLKLTHVFAVAVQSDGKVLVGITGQFLTGIRRLNVDGTEDSTFNNVVLNANSDRVLEIEILPDGKFVASGRFDRIFSQTGGASIACFNANGTYDSSFSTNFTGGIEEIEVLADGRLLVGGSYENSSQGFLIRLTANGTVDGTFGVIGTSLAVRAIKVQTDGKIVFGGPFTNVNGDTTKRGVARAGSDGILDSSFNTNTNGSFGGVGSLAVRPDGKVLVGGTYFFSGGGSKPIVLLNSDGTVDNSFTAILPVNVGVSTIQLLSGGKILLGFYGNAANGNGLMRINANGSTDTSITYYTSRLASSRKVVEQPDGKVIVVGEFKAANNTPRSGIARFNVDGTLDTTFNPPVDEAAVFAVALQPDGKIVLGTIGGNVLKRLNTDGSIDPTFTPPALEGYVYEVAVLPNGEILVGGFVRLAQTGSFTGLRKFSSFGVAIPINASFQSPINKIYPLSTGKILVGGGEGLFRIGADGTQDTTFSADRFSSIADIDVQSDGKIVAVGNFAGLAGNTSQKNIGRVTADGFSDPTFAQSTDGQLFGVKVQPDGKILVAGGMAFVGGVYHPGMVRLNSGGSIDSSFTANTNDNVFDVALLSTGKIFIAGSFTKVNDISRVTIARLNNSVVPARTPFDFDGDGRTDIVAYRPSTSVWHQLLGVNYQYSAVGFGINEDIVAPADFDGDGKTDLAIFRPSTGVWWYRSSAQSNAFRAVQWGQSGDIPLPSDFNGDGKDDFVFYRPSNNSWYRLTDTGTSSIFAFGTTGDKPVIGDFDGDGKADPAIFRPSTGVWWYASSAQSNAFRAVQFGTAEDIPAAADYDGDGKTDIAVFRPSNGGWYILNSSNNSVTIVQFGQSGDKPVAGDYDGDGKSDIAIYRPSNGSWYILRSTAGFAGLQFGASTDIPIPNAFQQ